MEGNMHLARKGRGFLFLALSSAGILAAACQQRQSSGTAGDPVQRGEYLVTAMGCNDCHTPWAMGPSGPAPDMTKMLSGHPQDLSVPSPPALPMETWNWAGFATMTAFAGPWGISYAANLTPDQNTGIGIWDEQMFIKTIRNGRHMAEGRPLQPPMPWPWYAKLTDDDLKAVYAYLRSIPPIENRVPDYQPPKGDE
jgi:mono/diheme cytochrome c family protein